MENVLTDPVWRDLGPRLWGAKRCPNRARGGLPDRLFLEAVLYRARTGVSWRNLPAEFGSWQAVYKRVKNWQRTGIWDRLLTALPVDNPLQAVQVLFVKPGL
jgi:transposase